MTEGIAALDAAVSRLNQIPAHFTDVSLGDSAVLTAALAFVLGFLAVVRRELVAAELAGLMDTGRVKNGSGVGVL